MNNFKIVLSTIDVVIISINIFIYMITSVVFGYTYITNKIINLDSVVILTLIPITIIIFILYFTYSNKKIYLMKCSYEKLITLEHSGLKREISSSDIQKDMLDKLKSLSESHLYALLFTLTNFILCFYLQYEFIVVIFKKLF